MLLPYYKDLTIRLCYLWLLAPTSLFLSVLASADATDVYFGDTHLHTSLSADASLMGNRSASPDIAYRFAKGLPVLHPQNGSRVQLDQPLDFLAVADHAEYLGVIPALLNGDERVGNTPITQKFVSLVKAGALWQAFGIIRSQSGTGNIDPGFQSPEVTAGAWQEIVDSADLHYQPGQFTTLIGWEWSAMPSKAGEMAGPNLHRVVLMREDADTARQFLPYSSADSQNPEDLWDWLDQTATQHGANFIAIPHNSNIGMGKMFDLVDSKGQAIDRNYATKRMRWEPIAEATQLKGDSETHPFLSPEDPFADYEQFILVDQQVSPGDYIRGALRRGLEIETRTGVNPYQFGLIGASDAHTGLATTEESNFHGKWATQSTPAQLLAEQATARGSQMGAAGLAAVWANDNTREEIFDAFRRKEVYSTTGTRMTVRFFGSFSFSPKDLRGKNIARRGYKKGVPMGGQLHRTTTSDKHRAPSFLVLAAKDPDGANLDRIQIVKGWVDQQGQSHERIFDVALADIRDPATEDNPRIIKPVGNTVDLETATYTNSIGAPQLATVWVDPDYQENQQSLFYYARVLEIPTPRHSLFDAIALGKIHPADLPATVQERAYTSPIWVR